MDEQQLAEIRQRADAATPGPWRWNSYSGIMAVVPTSHPLAVPDDVDSDGKSIAWVAWIDGGPRQHEIGGDELHTHEARNDALFIEHSREDVPALLDHIAKLREIVQAVANADLCDGVCWSCYMMPPWEQHTPDCVITKTRALLDQQKE